MNIVYSETQFETKDLILYSSKFILKQTLNMIDVILFNFHNILNINNTNELKLI